MAGKFSRRRLFGGVMAALAGWLGSKATADTPPQPAPTPPPATPAPWPPNPFGPWQPSSVTTYVYDAGVTLLTGPVSTTVYDGNGRTITPATGNGGPTPESPGEPPPGPDGGEAPAAG